MAGDFVPKNDSDFEPWLKQFSRALAANPAPVGIPADEAGALAAEATAWMQFRADAGAALIAYRSAIQERDTRRKALEKTVRALARRIQAWPGVTNMHREALGLTLPDAIRTAAPAPHAAPTLEVSTTQRLQHRIRFFSVSSAGTITRRKPPGAKGCAIFRSLASGNERTPPTAPVEGSPIAMTFLALVISSPHTVFYSSRDAGKTAFYMARWMGGPRGDQPGPWSETVEATVVG